MANIPEKCSRCRAPIDWDDGAAFTKCEFCGFKNYLTNYDQPNSFKNYSKRKKISIFPNSINIFSKEKRISLKTFFYKNRKSLIFIILAGVFTSITISSIKNYSDFVANKKEEENSKKKIILEENSIEPNKSIDIDSKEEKIIVKKTTKDEPVKAPEKISVSPLEQKIDISSTQSFITANDKLQNPEVLRIRAEYAWYERNYIYAHQLYTLAFEKEGDKPTYRFFATRGILSYENNIGSVEDILNDLNLGINNVCINSRRNFKRYLASQKYEMGTCQWAYLSRAKIKEKYLDDLDGALTDIKEARRYEKWWYEPYFYKARILFKQGKFEEFYKVQKIAHRKLYLDIKYDKWYGGICNYKYFLDKDFLWFVFYDAKAKCDNSAELKFMRAKYFLKKENYEEAYLNINQALNLKPNNEEFLEFKNKISKKDI